MPRKQPSATPVAAPTLLRSSIHTRQSLSCHASLFQPTDFSHFLIVNNPPPLSEALARSLALALSQGRCKPECMPKTQTQFAPEMSQMSRLRIGNWE
jgi:hypothetical protein